MQTDDERYIGYLFADVARLMRTVFDRRVRSLGLTRAQWLVLSRLNRSPGLSQVELADMMEVEKATAGKHIDRLELKGWVVRRPDPADRRIKRLYLTPIAQRVQKRMWRIAQATRRPKSLPGSNRLRPPTISARPGLTRPTDSGKSTRTRRSRPTSRRRR